MRRDRAFIYPRWHAGKNQGFITSTVPRIGSLIFTDCYLYLLLLYLFGYYRKMQLNRSSVVPH